MTTLHLEVFLNILKISLIRVLSGPNMLVARLATRKAKPNGQFYVKDCNAADFMKAQKINDLPGNCTIYGEGGKH